jgi:hypothetical protein
MKMKESVRIGQMAKSEKVVFSNSLGNNPTKEMNISH